MGCAYDEDLAANPFFRELREEHAELFGRCVLEGWIVCVPRSGSLVSTIFVEGDFLSHLLVPDEELPDAHFFSLTEKSASVSGRSLFVERNSQSPCEVKILFEETFYAADDVKYKVWCVDRPLNRPYDPEGEAPSCEPVSTLADCVQFLWKESGGRDVLEGVDRLVADFAENGLREDAGPMSAVRDQVGQLYENCLKVAFRNARLKANSKTCRSFAENVKTAVESYVHRGIYDKLFAAVAARSAREDAELNKIIRNLADVQLRDLEVDEDFDRCIPYAKMCLSRIQSYGTLMGKVKCIKNTIEAIHRKSDGDNKLNTVKCYVSTDDMIPVMIFLVIKSGLPNWYAHLNFMKHFRFSVDQNVHSDEISYTISTLEAVIEHIRSKVSIEMPSPNFPTIPGDFDAETNSISCSESSIELSNSTKNLVYLFDQIKLSNYETVKDMLVKNADSLRIDKKNHNGNGEFNAKQILSIEEILGDDADDTESALELCHPLCVCNKCCRIFSANSPTVSSQDSRGFTALHVACIYGKSRMADLILDLGAYVNAVDCKGSTPLHYAASRGHQNSLLLLLHAGADVEKENLDKNTALHLATNNGHESCVKALIYFAEYSKIDLNLSKENDIGYTPLHLAAKWGYESIARILLQYGANPWKTSSCGKSPLDVAHNNVIEKLLCSANVPCLNDFVNVISVDKSTAAVVDLSSKKSKLVLLDLNDDRSSGLSPRTKDAARGNSITSKIKPQSTEEIRQIERLFQAIAFGDINLACFYMNINIINSNSTNKISSPSECHPLCSCDQCKSLNFNKFDNHVDFEFNINTCDLKGNTALHTATKHGQNELCKILLQNNASPDIQNKYGSTPLHIAAQDGKLAISKILINHGTNLDLKDSSGNTSLHLACISGNIEIVKLILDNSTNVHSLNMKGLTPLDEAKDRMYMTIMALFEGT